MNLSSCLGPFVVLAAALPTAWATAASVVPAQRPPNIVLIVADDLGWNSVGYHGGWIDTPHIDRLAQQGVSLERFYVSPMCSPTRVGLMTGRYPMRLGMARTVVRPWIRRGLPPEEVTLPEALAQAGYRHRGAFGKWHLGHLAPQWHPMAQGFTAFEGLYNGAADYWTRNRDGEIDWQVNDVPTPKPGYTTDLITEAAVGFIRDHAGQEPFFCYVPFSAPHDPLQAPPEMLARYAALDDNPADGRPSDLQALAAMVTRMDAGIGRILQALEQAKAADNTLVWFMSDNGGINRLKGVNRPLRDGKLTVYEGGVCVPSAVWWPGFIEGGRKITQPVINLDILPTLVRVSGREPLSDLKLDGVDVLDVLARRGADVPPASGGLAARDLYFFTGQSGLDDEQIAVSDADGWKLVVIGPDIRRPEGFKSPKHRVELFNLSADPGEQKDLAADQTAKVAELGHKLVAFRASEPADSMAPSNRPPQGLKPPPGWKNSLGEPAASRPEAAPVAATGPDEPAKRPNVIFVLIDDMGYGDLSCYGGRPGATPNIDRLATEGVRFTQFYVNAPICSPSRVAFTTGQYPGRWKITSYLDNRAADRRRGLADWLDPKAPSLGRMLAEAGYYTAHVGKWHMGGQRDVGDAPTIQAYGFASSLTNFEGLGERVLPRFVPNADGKPLNHGPTKMSADLGGGPIHWIDRHNVTAFYVDRAIKELRAAAGQGRPFYLNLWLDDMHTPIQASPQRRGDGSPAAAYAGVLTEMDAQLGRLFDLVRSDPGLRDNTLILLSSDNGPEDGQGSPGIFRGGKARLYEGGNRSPLIVWHPAMTAKAAGSTNDKTVVVAMDIPPSVLELVGVRPPKDVRFDGLNMSAALVGRAAPVRERRIFWVRPPDRPGPQNSWPDLAVREMDWKLLVNRDGSRPELYNLADDPKESRNLAAEHSDLTRRLSAVAMTWDKRINR